MLARAHGRVMTIDDDRACEYWVERAKTRDALVAVHPDTRWLAYDAWTRRMLQSWTLARLRRFRPRYRRCADLGCGFGDWTEQFAGFADEIHACDISPEFASATQIRLARHRAAHVSCADIRTVVIPPRVDLVYAGAVLMYVSDAAVVDVFRRIRDSLAQDGIVIVRDFCAFNAGSRAVDPASGTIYRRASELVALAERARFRCTELRCSPSIYGEMMGGALFQWPMRMLWRIATLPWLRASYSLILRI
jgi:SAM-dependent methyltransferase